MVLNVIFWCKKTIWNANLASLSLCKNFEQSQKFVCIHSEILNFFSKNLIKASVKCMNIMQNLISDPTPQKQS